MKPEPTVKHDILPDSRRAGAPATARAIYATIAASCPAPRERGSDLTDHDRDGDGVRGSSAGTPYIVVVIKNCRRGRGDLELSARRHGAPPCRSRGRGLARCMRLIAE